MGKIRRKYALNLYTQKIFSLKVQDDKKENSINKKLINYNDILTQYY